MGSARNDTVLAKDPRYPAMTESLCTHCRSCQAIVSGKGSRFFLCRKSLGDRRYPKYPPQPVVRCEGFEPAPSGETASPN